MVKPLVPEAQETADLINDLILKSQELLKNHPLNLKRMSEGKDPANSIWPWSPGYRPQMPAFSETFPQVKKGAVISAVDLINGIGYYAGLRRIAVEGATGLYNTNYENKVAAALEALKTDDFVYLHIEASDEAGHEGDIDLKLLTIENLWRLPYCPTILLPANFAPIPPILYRSLSGIRASNRMKCRRMTRYRHATAFTVC